MGRVLSRVMTLTLMVTVAVGSAMVTSAHADFSGFPFASCWHQSSTDSPNAGAIDIRAFSLDYDCSRHMLLLQLFATGRIDDQLSLIKSLTIDMDTDGNRADGCNGADYHILLRTSYGGAINPLFRTPSCAGGSWVFLGDVVEMATIPPDLRHSGVLWSLDAIGSPSSFRWWGSITQWADPTQTDRFPDTGAVLASCYRTPARASISGYWLATADGAAHGLGDVAACSGAVTSPLSSPAVGIAATIDRRGTWVAAADGGITTYGDARFFGSTGGIQLHRPIVGIAPTPSGNGYWLVASDGGIFSFGDARFFGSTGAMRLNRPIVGMAATPSGRGYWLVASDGGIFSFGDARFFGSTGAMRLNRPIVGMARAHDGRGYWLVASDGGVFAFGSARFHGSTGNLRLVSPIVGMSASVSGAGYRFVANDGGVFAFGDAGFAGSLAHASLPTGGVVGIAP